jgi:hypothetical protein
MSDSNIILERLLHYEMNSMAAKLGLITTFDDKLDEEFLIKLVGLMDRASRKQDEYSARVVVMVCALMWTHYPSRRSQLTEVMILMLSRVGYSLSGAMIDGGYDDKNKSYSNTNSWITECCVAVQQAKSEVVINGRIYLLTMPQKRIWDKMEGYPALGISAPTSAGKSFVITLKCVDLLLKKPGVIVYVVPTLSLVSQVSLDFHRQLREFGITEYQIKTTYNLVESDHKTIYIFTQEKAMAAFSQEKQPFANIRALVIDEIQNIERVAAEDDQRAKRLYDAITEFRHQSNIDHIVISGPRISGLKTLGVEMFGVETESEEILSSPVASLTYSIYRKRKNVYLFRQYSDLLSDPLEIEVSAITDWRWFGQASYTDDFHHFLTGLLNRFGDDAVNIVFSPTAAQARKTALQLYPNNSLDRNVENVKLDSLVKYLKDTVHEKYDLCQALEHGVAYHHGKVPPHARRLLEYAIKEKLVRNVVCTTTLMQGVNLPAQNIFIRTPKLFVTKRNGYDAALTNYELANLRGRAGRLFKDLLGRAFVIEENSFVQEAEQSELMFRDEYKELRSGYGATFLQHQDEVETALVENSRPDLEVKDYAYITTYIRQTILRFGDRAEDRLRTVGIYIDSDLRINIQESLSKIEVDPETCLRNRYWDPFDLDEIFRTRATFRVPTSPGDFNFSDALTQLLIRMRDAFPYYCERYFKVPDSEGMTKHFAILASEWLKEKPLVEILRSSYYDGAERIEKAIEELQGVISYGIPGLLKPVYDVVAPSSMVPRFIECGAYKPFTRFLIEENIPRETALRIAQATPSALKNNFDRRDLPKILDSVAEKLDFWDLVQVETNR